MRTYLQSDPKIRTDLECFVPPHLGFAVDASSSMEELLEKTINVYNQLISEQQKLNLQSQATLLTFNHTVHPVYSAMLLAQIDSRN
jgi:hypothetical protein